RRWALAMRTARSMLRAEKSGNELVRSNRRGVLLERSEKSQSVDHAAAAPTRTTFGSLQPSYLLTPPAANRGVTSASYTWASSRRRSLFERFDDTLHLTRGRANSAVTAAAYT